MYRLKKQQIIKEFDGFYHLFSHFSEVCQCDMRFSVYIPKANQDTSYPCIYWLSGLTCSDENFRIKSGVARYASELGIALVIPDTSPRGDHVADDDRYHLGQAAGFYLNASQPPWQANYQMHDYITKELPKVLKTSDLPLAYTANQTAIMGHSMGGHGALMIAFRNPNQYTSVSAFSPICNPASSPWGRLAFEHYLGSDQRLWRDYDSCCLLEDRLIKIPILVDQGDADEFYPTELRTESLINTCNRQGVEADIRLQPGYDHSFHFITTFIGDHLRWHRRYLKGANP